MTTAHTAATKVAGAGFILAFCAFGAFAQQDPPSRVARLNYLSGNVSMQAAGATDWAPAEWNRPFSTGDYLYTDSGARAELHVDIAAIRVGERTSFEFLNLTDQAVQIKLTDGDAYVTVHHLDPDQVFEVDTPNAAVSILRTGSYRFRVDGNSGMTFVVVRQGQAELTGGGQAATVSPGQSIQVSGFDQLSYNLDTAPPMDDLDTWCSARDNHEARLDSTRYIPPTMVGYEDLDDNGSWDTSEYGPVWYPRSVPIGWAPYHNGHWVWMDPWGWTWIDDARWGFAPFHYGRWLYYHDRWGWCPGPMVVAAHGGAPAPRPHYAPALVAWFGGAHWGVGISLGRAPSVGWVPLGVGEVYTPPYHCSPRYFNNVNVSNTRIVNNVNITSVYQTVYVNKTAYRQTFANANAPNAVMAMHQNDFASGRPVRQSAVVVRNADFRQMQPVQSLVTAPPVAPPARRAFVLNPGGRPVAHPSARIEQQAVVVKNAPPPAQMVQVRPAFAGNPNSKRGVHDVSPQPNPAAAQRPSLASPATAQPKNAPSILNQPQPRFSDRSEPATQPGSHRIPEAPQANPGAAQRPSAAPPAAMEPKNAPQTHDRPQPRFSDRNQPATQPGSHPIPQPERQDEAVQPAHAQPREATSPPNPEKPHHSDAVSPHPPVRDEHRAEAPAHPAPREEHKTEAPAAHPAPRDEGKHVDERGKPKDR